MFSRVYPKSTRVSWQKISLHCTALVVAWMVVTSTVRSDEVIVAEEVLPAQPTVLTVEQQAVQFQAALRAADEMMRSQRFRDAAREYAKLSLRFGQSSQLYGRRFVAQVLCREFGQATMVIASARMMELPIVAKDLPAGDLEVLVNNPLKVSAATQWLAHSAATSLDDKDALEAVAVWLKLVGEQRRSQVFADRASDLQPQATVAAVSAELSPESLAELPEEIPGPSEAVVLPAPIEQTNDRQQASPVRLDELLLEQLK